MTRNRKSYISEVTWKLIDKRQEARSNGDADLEKELTKKIKTQADSDKKKTERRFWRTMRKAQIKQKRWEGNKAEKMSYTPNFTKLKDIRGNRVPHGSKSEATAKFLEHKSMD